MDECESWRTEWEEGMRSKISGHKETEWWGEEEWQEGGRKSLLRLSLYYLSSVIRKFSVHTASWFIQCQKTPTIPPTTPFTTVPHLGNQFQHSKVWVIYFDVIAWCPKHELEASFRWNLVWNNKLFEMNKNDSETCSGQITKKTSYKSKWVVSHALVRIFLKLFKDHLQICSKTYTNNLLGTIICVWYVFQ